MTPELIERRCMVCGRGLIIELSENGEYTGGHYFGKVRFPVGEGEDRIVGKTRIDDMELDVVEWTGEHEEMEYWECHECFNEE
ncbi:MAG: hypothetical protein R6V01_08325 [Thermoplasmatota archaeon]